MNLDFIFNQIPNHKSLENLIMNIGGSEWAIIIFLFLFLIVGSKKLPEFTRLLGRAVGEYQKTRESFFQNIPNSDDNDPLKTRDKGNNITLNQESKNSISIDKDIQQNSIYNLGKSITGPIATEREKLEKIALSLGITDLNKSDDELRIIINKKMGF